MSTLRPVGVRPAGPDDFAAWFALFEAVAAEGIWLGAEHPVDRDRRRALFDRGVAGPGSAVLLAERDGALAGVLSVAIEGGVAELGMAVAAPARGTGVGTALLLACIDWSRANGAHKVALQTWPHNAAALALYRRHGFSVEGRLVRHYRRRNGELWDAIEMGFVLDTASPGSPHADAPLAG